MNAQSVKQWNVSSGDFKRSDETDYEKKFQSAKKQNQLFEKKIVLAFSLSGLGIVLLILELLTKN